MSGSGGWLSSGTNYVRDRDDDHECHRDMSKLQDGIVARFLNRPISGLVTRFLLKFPIHPNTCTISLLVLPLCACLFLVRGDYLSIVIGAIIFQLYSIFDGCDGEIARAKNLESKFGQRLDSLCDSLASGLFVIALGFGLNSVGEGLVCAALIAANEWLLLIERQEMPITGANLDNSFYQKHHRMIANSGLLNCGEKLVWWIFQLTKRDVAVLAFLLFALIGHAHWILNLWLVVAGGSLILQGIAAARSGLRRAEIEMRLPRT